MKQAVCVCENGMEKDLTKGRRYIIISEDAFYLLVLDDRKRKCWYLKSRFKIINKIHELWN